MRGAKCQFRRGGATVVVTGMLASLSSSVTHPFGGERSGSDGYAATLSCCRVKSVKRGGKSKAQVRILDVERQLTDWSNGRCGAVLCQKACVPTPILVK